MEPVKSLKFPPVIFFILILIGFAVVNGYVFLKGDETGDDTGEIQEMMIDMLEPTAVVDQNIIEKPSKLTVTVYALAPGMKMDYSGFQAKIVIYRPDGEIYLVEKGIVGETQKVIFEVPFSEKTPEGRYTVIPMIGKSQSQMVMGDSVFFEVK